MARMKYHNLAYQFDIELTDVQRPIVEIDNLNHQWQWLEPRVIPLRLAHPERHSQLMQELSAELASMTVEIQDEDTVLILTGRIVSRDDHLEFHWMSCEWTEDGKPVLSATMNAIQGSVVRRLIFRGTTYKE